MDRRRATDSIARRPPMYPPAMSALADVLEAKNDLHTGLKIPMELVDAILDFAKYWPHTTTVRRSGEMTIRTGRGHREEEFIVRYNLRIYEVELMCCS
jgi:hypothetical protein